MKGNKLSSGVEAILFALGEPVPTEKLAQALDCTPEEVERACRALADTYQRGDRSKDKRNSGISSGAFYE